MNQNLRPKSMAVLFHDPLAKAEPADVPAIGSRKAERIDARSSRPPHRKSRGREDQIGLVKADLDRLIQGLSGKQVVESTEEQT